MLTIIYTFVSCIITAAAIAFMFLGICAVFGGEVKRWLLSQ